MNLIWPDVAIALGLFGGLLLTLEVSYRLGRRTRQVRENTVSYLATIQAAVLGLLGILLGFSFAGAQTRYVVHQDLVVQEANAIDTAYLRADLLAEPERNALRETLQRYTATRVALFYELDAARFAKIRAEAESLHAPLWNAAVAGVRQSPEYNVVVINAVNKVIDLHAERLDAMERHLPGAVLAAMILSAMVGVGSLGYGCGLAAARSFALTTALTFLVALALWLTIDLDYPRQGVIRVDQSALVDLQTAQQNSR